MNCPAPPSLTCLLTWPPHPPGASMQLAAEDELRASGVPFAVVRPVALTEEPEGMPLRLEQGDTLRGKVSREVGLTAVCVCRGGLLAGRERAATQPRGAQRGRAPCEGAEVKLPGSVFGAGRV